MRPPLRPHLHQPGPQRAGVADPETLRPEGATTPALDPFLSMVCELAPAVLASTPAARNRAATEAAGTIAANLPLADQVAVAFSFGRTRPYLRDDGGYVDDLAVISYAICVDVVLDLFEQVAAGTSTAAAD